MLRGSRIFGTCSGEIAAKRLKLLLAADKTNCSGEFLEMIKDDVFAVVSRYLEIDRGDVQVELTRGGLGGRANPVPALCVVMPVDGRLVRGHFHAVI